MRGCSVKKVFAKISQNSQKNTCARKLHNMRFTYRNRWFFYFYCLLPTKIQNFFFSKIYKIIARVVLSVRSCHVTYTFQSESTLYSCLNVKKLLLEAGAESEV